MRSVPSKADLIRSLSLLACETQRPKTRLFLRGLSTGELMYIAEFIGCCTLEDAHPCKWSRTELSARIEAFDRSRPRRSPDNAHKMVLLFEYICHSTPAAAPAATRTASA